MEKWFTGILIVGLSLVMASCAFAQILVPEDTGLNYSIVAGAAFPLSSDVQTSSSAMIGAAWYSNAGANNNASAQVGLSVDWTNIDRADGGGERLFRCCSITSSTCARPAVDCP